MMYFTPVLNILAAVYSIYSVFWLLVSPAALLPLQGAQLVFVGKKRRRMPEFHLSLKSWGFVLTSVRWIGTTTFFHQFITFWMAILLKSDPLLYSSSPTPFLLNCRLSQRALLWVWGVSTFSKIIIIKKIVTFSSRWEIAKMFSNC